MKKISFVLVAYCTTNSLVLISLYLVQEIMLVHPQQKLLLLLLFARTPNRTVSEKKQKQNKVSNKD